MVEEWTRDGGVLLMGYEMYRLLSLKKSFVTGRKRKSKKPVGPIIIDLDEEDRQQELMKGFLLPIQVAHYMQHSVNYSVFKMVPIKQCSVNTLLPHSTACCLESL